MFGIIYAVVSESDLNSFFITGLLIPLIGSPAA